MTWYAEAAKGSLGEVALINIIDVPVAIGVGYYLSISALEIFGFVLLLEATGLMFIGGAIDLSMTSTSIGIANLLKLKRDKELDSVAEKRKRLQQAAIFTISGVVLFAESLALTLPYL